jgi:O-methyltransferase involved in polyketide biosynthesis
MKTTEKKLSVASTSALVLSAVKEMYTDGYCRNYMSHIDLASVEQMAEELYTISPLFRATIYYRKQMVRRWIKECLLRYPSQQLVILAAGLDPLALQIAEQFPDMPINIYEVDQANLAEKEYLYSMISVKDKRLHTIHADITNIPMMMGALIDAGYQPDQPTLIVFEGIVHYLYEEQFLKIMRSFCSRMRNNAVIMDYSLPAEDLSTDFRPRAMALMDVLEDHIGARIKQYSRKKILNLLSLLEAELCDVFDLQATEFLLNGYNRYYLKRGEGMMEMVTFYI